MDPITSFTILATEITKLVNVVITSQPPELQKQMWDVYWKDILWWRKFLKIDKD